MSDKSPEMVAIEAVSREIGVLRVSIDKAFTRGSNRMDRQDDRLRKVEHRQSWFMGIGAALGAVIALLQRLPAKLWEFITS